MSDQGQGRKSVSVWLQPFPKHIDFVTVWKGQTDPELYSSVTGTLFHYHEACQQEGASLCLLAELNKPGWSSA